MSVIGTPGDSTPNVYVNPSIQGVQSGSPPTQTQGQAPVQDSMSSSPSARTETLVTPQPIDAPALPQATLNPSLSSETIDTGNPWLNTVAQGSLIEGIISTVRLQAAAAFVEAMFSKDRTVASWALSKLVAQNIMEKAEKEIAQHAMLAAIGFASAALATVAAAVSVAGKVKENSAAQSRREADAATKQSERVADKEGIQDVNAGSNPQQGSAAAKAKKDAEDLHAKADQKALAAEKTMIAGRTMDTYARSLDNILGNIIQASTKGSIAEIDQQKVLLEALLNIMRNSADSANQAARALIDLIQSMIQMLNKMQDESARNFSIGRG